MLQFLLNMALNTTASTVMAGLLLWLINQVFGAPPVTLHSVFCFSILLNVVCVLTRKRK